MSLNSLLDPRKILDSIVSILKNDNFATGVSAIMVFYIVFFHSANPVIVSQIIANEIGRIFLLVLIAILTYFSPMMGVLAAIIYVISALNLSREGFADGTGAASASESNSGGGMKLPGKAAEGQPTDIAGTINSLTEMAKRLESATGGDMAGAGMSMKPTATRGSGGQDIACSDTDLMNHMGNIGVAPQEIDTLKTIQYESVDKLKRDLASANPESRKQAEDAIKQCRRGETSTQSETQQPTTSGETTEGFLSFSEAIDMENRRNVMATMDGDLSAAPQGGDFGSVFAAF